MRIKVKAIIGWPGFLVNPSNWGWVRDGTLGCSHSQAFDSVQISWFQLLRGPWVQAGTKWSIFIESNLERVLAQYYILDWFWMELLGHNDSVIHAPEGHIKIYESLRARLWFSFIPLLLMSLTSTMMFLLRSTWVAFGWLLFSFLYIIFSGFN